MCGSYAFFWFGLLPFFQLSSLGPQGHKTGERIANANEDPRMEGRRKREVSMCFGRGDLQQIIVSGNTPRWLHSHQRERNVNSLMKKMSINTILIKRYISASLCLPCMTITARTRDELTPVDQSHTIPRAHWYGIQSPRYLVLTSDRPIVLKMGASFFTHTREIVRLRSSRTRYMVIKSLGDGSSPSQPPEFFPFPTQ